MSNNLSVDAAVNAQNYAYKVNNLEKRVNKLEKKQSAASWLTSGGILGLNCALLHTVLPTFHENHPKLSWFILTLAGISGIMGFKDLLELRYLEAKESLKNPINLNA